MVYRGKSSCSYMVWFFTLPSFRWLDRNLSYSFHLRGVKSGTNHYGSTQCCGSASKNLSILIQKIASKHSEIWSGWFIPHPDSGSRGQKGTGSRIRKTGSTTLTTLLDADPQTQTNGVPYTNTEEKYPYPPWASWCTLPQDCCRRGTWWWFPSRTFWRTLRGWAPRVPAQTGTAWSAGSPSPLSCTSPGN